MAWAMVAGAAVSVVGGAIMKDSAPDQQTVTTENKLDPRADSMVYGTGRRLRDGVTPTYSGTRTEGRYEMTPTPEGGSVPVWVPGTDNQVMTNPESDYINDPGITGSLYKYMNEGQAPGMQKFGDQMTDYMQNWAADSYNRSQHRAQALQDSNIAAPTMGVANMTSYDMNAASMSPKEMSAAQMQAAQAGANGNGFNASLAGSASINSPGQNNLGLLNAYNDMIYGDPAKNPYLTGAIQKGINQSTNAFNDYLDSSKSAVYDVLANNRGEAISNGGYGGSRQGIAEGRAVGDFSKGLTQAATRFGMNNTDAAVGAQAGAFDAGQNRSLNAMSGLGSQQYGVAGQNAGFQQQTGLANAGFLNTAGQFNAGQGIQNNQFNAGLLQQANLNNANFQQSANQFNASAGNNAAQNNAGWLQGANQFNAAAKNNASQVNSGYNQATGTNNLNSQISTNQLNSANQLAGLNASSSLNNQAYTFGLNNQDYGLNKNIKVAGSLQPYMGFGGSAMQSQPLYQNPMGNAMGGAAMGAGLYNAYNRSGGLPDYRGYDPGPHNSMAWDTFNAYM